MIYEKNARQGQLGEETTCDLTLLQPDQSSVLQDPHLQDHQVQSKIQKLFQKVD